MAQIGITEQEVADFSPKINSILDWFGQLQAVDVSGVPPAIHVSERGTPLRQDQPHTYEARAQLLAQAPSTDGAYVRVPKTTTGADAEAAAPASTSAPAAAAAKAKAPAAPAAAAAPAASTSGAAPAGGAGGAGSDAERDALLAMDFRVGKIISCERHPEADSLYVEKIDIGEAEPRTIVSGLVKYVPIEQMTGRLVVIAANLKPRNMRGIKSAGMVLAASDDPKTRVEPIAPPAGAQVGERVWFGDSREQPAPAVPNAVEKKKLWEVVAPGLRTLPDKVASWRGAHMMTSAGPVTSETLGESRIA